MADDVRETIRAAQAAELRGDTDGAIALLRHAAAMYRGSGNRRRALQMLRQAHRLDGSRADVAEELRRLEWLPDSALGAPATPAPRSSEGGADLRLLKDAELLTAQTLEALSLAAADETLDATALERALESAAMLLPDPEASEAEAPAQPGSGGRILERGPTRADPALEAWCSFCCRPRTEVGALIAGPAGAFICAACARESSGLLGGAAPGAPQVSMLDAAAPAPLLGLVGQDAARMLLERALSQVAPRVLLLGPEGSGKSTWMRALAAEGRATLADGAQRVAPPPGRALVIEDVDRLPPAEQQALAAWLGASPGFGVILTARAAAPAALLTLRDGALQLPVYAPEALVAATGGALGAQLCRCVGPVVCLAAPDVALLLRVAQAQLALRADVQVPEEALARLAKAAAGSGHALAALLARLAPGRWTLEALERPPASRPRRGKRKA